MIRQVEFKRRRDHLMQMVGEEAVILLCAATHKTRNSDVHYPYRQDSDFHYLTGFGEPEAVLALLPEGKGGKCILFCRQRDRKREAWDGPMIGLERAVSDYGMDQAFAIGELDKHIPKLFENRDKVIYSVGRDTRFDQQVIRWLNEARAKFGAAAPDELMSVDHELHEMRLLKSRGELSAMRRSAKVAAQAHREAMALCQPGMNEAEISAVIQYTLQRNQCQVSYLPIVAGGVNGCVLHYIANNQALNDGEMLLIDAGAEYQCYASDITRTFPINGRFSGEQKALYEVVLAAQTAAIEQVRPGGHWQQVHDVAVREITQGLIDLKLLKGPMDSLLETEAYKPFYMHNTGHWLGLDVHDVGDYQVDGHSRSLEPGMVMTVEPGIYISPECEQVPEQWRGMAIRIEDDVVVTKDHPEVLSRAAPKSVAEIETWMAE